LKIDKRNPVHWCLLGGFFLQALVGLLLRALVKRREPVVIFYGHKLNGNLLALHSALERRQELGLHPVFLTMDPAYLRELKAAGIACAWAGGPRCARLLARASAVVSDHGLHALQPLVTVFRLLGLRFFDVWHGIPFKGFDAEDFRLQHRYDEVWVASELCRELYVSRFGFAPERVVATGYARTDRLLRPESGKRTARERLGLPTRGPLILFAPTWAQDSAGRSLFPFGHAADEFMSALAGLAARHGGGIVLRSHLNSGVVAYGGHANVYALPVSRYPDTEAVLLACDILVCDWSSIAFDFLLLDRPTIFLDVEPPFRKGFSLGPEYRFGPVVRDLEGLLTEVGRALDSPGTYWRVNGYRHEEVKRTVYGSLCDGLAVDRCLRRLREIPGKQQ
jgi:CDP-glycerol glycerophosphotransferase (TagB/SpsB family)